MRRLPTVALVLLVLLAGCVAPMAGGDAGPAGESGTAGQTGSPGDGSGTQSATAAGPAPADDGSGEPPTTPQADPDQDRLGWEAGYWYNDPVAANNTDGLNASERDAVVARAMARVELVRQLEFREPVNVSVVGRDEFGAGQLGGGEPSEALRTFDNAKFEALFLVGDDADSIQTQESSLNASVGGYYSTESKAIVLVSSSNTPTLDGERTLAHELVHALQDQHFDTLGATARTRDAYNGKNGLVEGDANFVQYRYLDRCEGEWRCLQSPESGPGASGGTGGLHMGVYLLEYFPYADGPGLVAHLRDGSDWSAVNDAYDRVPTSATEVIYPDRYGTFEPRTVAIADDLRGGWERVRPPSRPDYARLGQSALAATFAYTLYDDYNRSRLVSPGAFLNRNLGGLNQSDPLNYDLPPVRGWVGDRLHVYERGEDSAYVWRLVWESDAAASRFADAYRDLLAHWGGSRDAADTWRVRADSPFTGAVFIDVDGSTVTVTHAPTTAGLAEVYPGAR